MAWLRSFKNRTNSADDYNTEFHIHNYCEMLYVTNGEIITKIADNEYRVGPGQMLMTCCLEGHGIKPVKVPYERIVMHIESEVLHNTGLNPFLISVLEHHPKGWNHLFDLNDYPEIKALIEKADSEINSTDPVAYEMSGAIFYQIILLLYRYFPDRFINTKKDEQMEDAKKYIEEHLTDFSSVQSMSKKYYMTTSHFIVRFKKHTGYTPQKYYNICRMANARYLLLNSAENLSAIAEKSGFSDVNSFVRAFRSMMGIPPGKFREENTKK